MSRQQKSITRSDAASESEPEPDSDSNSDDSTLDSGDESDSHQSDTSDTEYSDDDNEDIDMLQTEPRTGQLATNARQNEDKEMIRLHKALCYEDIVLWAVKDPNCGGRDVLAMDVFFRHHKGAEKKPKPYVSRFIHCYKPGC